MADVAVREAEIREQVEAEILERYALKGRNYHLFTFLFLLFVLSIFALGLSTNGSLLLM